MNVDPRNHKPSFDTVALAELPVLYRVARRMTKNDSDAEDLVSQTLLSAARAWDGFDGQYPRSWLIRILKNTHLAVIRSRASMPERAAFEETEFVDDGSWEEVNWRMIGGEILRVLETLPTEYRLAVALCDVEEMSYQEAADIMEVPVGTVRSRLFRGRRMIRLKLPAFAAEFGSAA